MDASGGLKLQQLGLALLDLSAKKQKLDSLEAFSLMCSRALPALDIQIGFYEKFIEEAKKLKGDHDGFKKSTAAEGQSCIQELNVVRKDLALLKDVALQLPIVSKEILLKVMKIQEVMVKELQETQTRYYERLRTLWREKDDAITINKHLQTQTTLHFSEIETLKAEVADYQCSSIIDKEKVNELKKVIEIKEEEIKNTQTQFSELLSARLTPMRGLVNVLRKEQSSLRDDVLQMSKTFIDGLQRLGQILSLSDAKNKKLEEERSLSAATSHTLISEVSALKKTLSITEEQGKSLKEKHDEMERKHLEEIQDLQSTIKMINTEHERKETRAQELIKELENDKDTLRKDLESCLGREDRLHKHISSITAQLKINEEMLETKEQQIEALAAERKVLEDSYRSSTSSLRGEIARLNDEAQKNVQSEHMKVILKEFSEVNERQKMLQKELSKRATEVEETRAVVLAKEKEVHDLKNQLANEKGEVKKLQADERNKTKKLEEVVQEKDKRLQALAKQCEKHEQESKRLSENLQALRVSRDKSYEELKQSLKISQQSGRENQSKLTQLEIERDAARKEVVALRAQVAKLEAELRALARTGEEREAENDRFRETIKSLESDLRAERALKEKIADRIKITNPPSSSPASQRQHRRTCRYKRPIITEEEEIEKEALRESVCGSSERSCVRGEDCDIPKIEEEEEVIFSLSAKPYWHHEE